MLRPSLPLATVALLLAPALLSAQTPQPPPRCDTAAHRQFDFWVGDWVVFAGKDTAGTNLVTLTEGGCIIHEHWNGSRGGSGQSFNFFDRTDGKWHQVWVDSGGNAARFAGTFADSSLRYTGEQLRPNGTRILSEMTFTKHANGTVRQVWRSSSDGGTTWTVAFDGLYRKRT